MSDSGQNISVDAGEWRSIPDSLAPDEDGGVLTRKNARIWTAVLEARRLPCRLRHAEGGWRLQVPASRMAEAMEELRQYERENRHWPPPPPPQPRLADNALATLSVLLLLASFHNLTLLDIDLFGRHSVDWPALGSAYAGKIRNGEWWRAVTALTLHADWLHLAGNLAVGAVFMVRLGRLLGSGLAWSLVLLSGLCGNALNALLQAYHHQAVGASTAVFGAVGLLAAFNLLQFRRALWRRWPLPVAAAAALLGLLGSGGERTDLGAHLFGFLFGMIFGAAAAWLLQHTGRPEQRINAVLALAAVGLVLISWATALLIGT